MAGLRSNLEGDVQNVTESARAVAANARAMTDWRFVVRQFPFAAAGVAAAIGYIVVPNRKQVIVPDPETLAKMAKMNQVWVKTGAPKASERQGSLLGGLLALVGGGATRFAINWATEQFKSSLAEAGKRTAAAKDEAEDPLPQASKYPPR
jgi:hypothetical protein